MNRDRFQFVFPKLLVLVGICASLLIIWTTKYGIGVSPDSTVYIEAAMSLVNGNGFYVNDGPMTQYPPGYPFLLAAASLFQEENILQAGRFLGILFYCSNLILFGLAVYMSTERSMLATFSAVLLFLCSAELINIHSMAWSESPFITLTLATFILIALHFTQPKRHLILIAASLVGIAIIIRYVGITLLPPLIFALLFLGDRHIKYKMRDTFILVTIAVIPLVIWIIRNYLLVQKVTNRGFRFHPLNFDHIYQLFHSVYYFILPVFMPFWMNSLIVYVFFVILIAILIYLISKRNIKRNVTSVHLILPVICILFFFSYIGFILISISFFDASTTLNPRIMMPALLAFTIGGISLVWSLTKELKNRYIWYGLIILIILSAIVNCYRSIPIAIQIHKEGLGYTAQRWRNSEIVSYLSNIDDSRVIYTNGPDAVEFLTGKEAIFIPRKFSALTKESNPHYDDQISQILLDCSSGRVIIAYLNEFNDRWYFPTIEELENIDACPVMFRFKDGVIFAR